MIVSVVLISASLLGLCLAGLAQNPLHYKYLFRNTILSKSKQYELAAVLRGRVYYPHYFYIPSLKQYLVYSSVDETGSFRHYEFTNIIDGKHYALLDTEGKLVQSFETNFRFSYRSGCMYGPKSYIPLLETGKTDTLAYHIVHNEHLNLSSEAFEMLFTDLYKTSDYIEFINLRASDDDNHQSGVIFKRQGKVEILLSGLKDSRMICYNQENVTTNTYDDYYLPDIPNQEAYPQSAPAMEMLPLVTSDTNPFLYWRTGLKRTIKIKKYHRAYSSGWQGIMKLHGIPIYVPGNGSGTAYVHFKVHNDIFKIKILDIEKADFIPAYNLGLHTFQLPNIPGMKDALVFLESVQNGGENRLGGGVYVVRPSANDNPSSDLPTDMTEKHFNTLPIYLQEALMDPSGAKELILSDNNITKWIPEMERLKNITKLTLNTSMTEIPDEISKFPYLQKLTIRNGNIKSISHKIAELKQLTELELFSNKLDSFPSVLLQLTSLKRLNIGANEISSLPEAIDQLHQLEYLSLVLTNVTTLPRSMIGMKKLHIDDSQDLETKVSPDFKHLFEYKKTTP